MKTSAYAEMLNDEAQTNTVIGKTTHKSFIAGALQVEFYSTATLHEGNSNVEEIVDYMSREPLSTVNKGRFFDVSRGMDGSTTYGKSRFSLGSTSDGRYIVDISAPIGSKFSVGVTYYYNPNISLNNLRYIGNTLGRIFANSPSVFPLPGMPLPVFP